MGDLHGQLRDLLHVMAHAGTPPKQKYLFLGDYVDRGNFGVETTLLLLAMKLQYPYCVFLLRGNHESRSVTNTYGFRHECLVKYDQEIFESFMELFLELPLAAIINETYFVVHGGLSPSLNSPKELVDMPKVREEIPNSGMLCDLMWADPKDELLTDFAENEQRRCSVFFGKSATEDFLKKNNLLTLIRAHQCVNNGYEAFFWQSNFPKVITIFSAENYCKRGNYGAYLSLIVS